MLKEPGLARQKQPRLPRRDAGLRRKGVARHEQGASVRGGLAGGEASPGASEPQAALSVDIYDFAAVERHLGMEPADLTVFWQRNGYGPPDEPRKDFDKGKELAGHHLVTGGIHL